MDIAICTRVIVLDANRQVRPFNASATSESNILPKYDMESSPHSSFEDYAFE